MNHYRQIDKHYKNAIDKHYKNAALSVDESISVRWLNVVPIYCWNHEYPKIFYNGFIFG